MLLLHANSFLAVSSLQQLVSVDFQDTFFTIITSKFQWTLHCVYCCLLFLLHFYCFIRMKCYYMIKKMCMSKVRSSRPEVFLRKVVLKICSKFTGKYPCRSVISIKLICNFIETAHRHGCSPVNLQHIFSRWLRL